MFTISSSLVLSAWMALSIATLSKSTSASRAMGVAVAPFATAKFAVEAIARDPPGPGDHTSPDDTAAV